MLVSLELPDILIMSEVLAAMMSSGLSVSSAAGGRGTESVCWLTFGRDRRGADTGRASARERRRSRESWTSPSMTKIIPR